MRKASLRASISTAAVVLIASWGCGDKPAATSSNEEAKVTGKVTIKGKPMTKGEVTFDAANYQRKDATPRTATVNSDGTYEVTALVGQNSVSVTGPEVTKHPELGYAALRFDVQSGTNTFDIALPPKPEAP